jgi:hypothetical protein
LRHPVFWDNYTASLGISFPPFHHNVAVSSPRDGSSLKYKTTEPSQNIRKERPKDKSHNPEERTSDTCHCETYILTSHDT